MSFDALAMHAVRDEIEREVVGGHVDAVFLINARCLGLEIFARRRVFLVCCLDPSDTRIYLTPRRVRRQTDRVTPFTLLVHKYVGGSRIIAIEQPRLERLFSIGLSSRPHGGPPREMRLVVEAIGRRSNLVLVDEDESIADALVRIPPSVNPARPLLPHLRYSPPPRERKLDPGSPALPSALGAEADRHPGPAWELLVAQVAGLSPLAARETVARATGASETLASAVSSWETAVDALRGLVAPVDTGAWKPTIAWLDGAPLAFAPYELRQFPRAEVRPYQTMSQVLAMVGAGQPGAAPYERLKRPVLDALGARIEALRRKRGSLERSLAAADRADDLREAGEAILANAHAIAPGAAGLSWNGRRIDLFPTLSAVENAQAYFRRYADARDARRAVPPLLEEVATELEYLDEMAVHVDLATSEKQIAALRRELDSTGALAKAPSPRKKPSAKPRMQTPAPGPFQRVSLAGAELLIGTSALGNETVTFRLGDPDDLWFHARGAPGAHVILRTGGHTAREEWINAAAGVAAAHSAARDAQRVEVDYTLRKHVRKLPGRTPGRVTYRNESTVLVTPETGSPRDAE